MRKGWGGGCWPKYQNVSWAECIPVLLKRCPYSWCHHKLGYVYFMDCKGSFIVEFPTMEEVMFCCKSFCDLRFRWLTWWTLGGTNMYKYEGEFWWTILWKVINLCFSRRVSKLSHQASSSIFLFEQDLVAPVTIIAASIWIFLVRFFCIAFNCPKQYQHIPKSGRMNEK